MGQRLAAVYISEQVSCVLNVGKVTYDTCLSIDGIALPIVDSARDLGVTISCDL